jgi:hypothetical protein
MTPGDRQHWPFMCEAGKWWWVPLLLLMVTAECCGTTCLISFWCFVLICTVFLVGMVVYYFCLTCSDFRMSIGNSALFPHWHVWCQNVQSLFDLDLLFLKFGDLFDWSPVSCVVCLKGVLQNSILVFSLMPSLTVCLSSSCLSVFRWFRVLSPFCV